MSNIVEFEDFVGHTITDIKRTHDELYLTLLDGSVYLLAHDQECCEDVYLEDVTGELDDLLNTPILKAEEASNRDKIAGVDADQSDSFTWTFYHLVTFKGAVTLRWFGSSSGYYSESVDITKVG